MANRFPLIFNSGAGQIQELAASDNLDLTSSNLVNAGILFTSSGSQTAPSLQIGSGTTYNPGLYSPGTDQLAVATNGTGKVLVDTNGTILVNTTIQATSNGGLSIENTGAGTFTTPLALLNRGTTNNTGVSLSFRGLSATSAETDYAYLRMLATDTTSRHGRIEFWTANSGTVTEKLCITREGLVGIGNTIPNTALEVASTSTDIFRINKTGMTGIGVASSMAFQLTQTNAQSATLASITAEFMTNWSGNLIFSTKPSNGIPNNTVTEAARIDSSGRLLVGTTSADGLISNISPVVAGAFKSHSGSVSIAPSTTVTIFTIPASNGEGAYTVTAIYVNSNNVTVFSAYAVILYDGSSTNAYRAMGFDGSLLSITVSGRDVQLTTGATYTQSIKWSFVKQAVA